MKKKNMFGPEPMKQQADRAKITIAVALITLQIFLIAVIYYQKSLYREIDGLKRQVVEQNIRAHQALNDRDSFAEQLKTCQAK